MIKVLTYATSKEQFFNNLVESADKFNYDLTVLGMGKEWKGFIDKLESTCEYLSELDDDTIVMFVDAYDVIFCRDSAEFEKAYKENFDYENKILFNAEALSNSIINNKFWCRGFNPPNKPETKDCKYKYLNSGVYIGTVKNIRIMLKEVLSRDDIKDDQFEIMKSYSKCDTNIEIDSGCKIFNTISSFNDDLDLDSGGSICNTYTGTKPCVIHGPGSFTSLNHCVKWAGLKSGYKKSKVQHNFFKALFYTLDYLIIFVVLVVFVFIFGWLWYNNYTSK